MGTVAKMKDRWGNRTVKQALAAANTKIIPLQKNIKANRIYMQNISRINSIRSRYHKCVKAVYGNLLHAKWNATVIGLTEKSSNVLKRIKCIILQVFFSSKSAQPFRSF